MCTYVLLIEKYPANIYLFKVTIETIENVWNMFKVNKNTRMTSMTSFWYFYCWLWTYFTPLFDVSIVVLNK